MYGSAPYARQWQQQHQCQPHLVFANMLPVGAFVAMTPVWVLGFTIALQFALSIISQASYRALKDPTDQFWVPKHRDPPAVLTDPALGVHRFVQTKTVRLHYVENGDRSKPLMLMVHGYHEFWYSYRHQLKEFSKQYWVVAMDMRGFGDSDKPQGAENYDAEILANDIKNIVYALGRDKFILVGNDWGGIIGWYFVLRNPQYIISYIMLNTCHPYVLLQGLRTSVDQIHRSWYMFFYQLPYVPELRAITDDMVYLNQTIVSTKTPPTITMQDLEAYKYNYGREAAFTGALNIYRANLYFKTSHELLGLGDSPSFPPGLIMFGTEDKVLDLLQEESARMAANTELHYIEGANFVQQDDPTAVNRLIWDFLKRTVH